MQLGKDVEEDAAVEDGEGGSGGNRGENGEDDAEEDEEGGDVSSAPKNKDNHSFQFFRILFLVSVRDSRLKLCDTKTNNRPEQSAICNDQYDRDQNFCTR